MSKRQYTPKQYLEAVVAAGGSRIKAAEALGCSVRAVVKNLGLCKARGMDVPESSYNSDRAAYMIREVEAAHAAAPDTFFVKGVSTLYGAEGEVKQQWVKTNVDDAARQEAIRAGIVEMCAAIPAQAPIQTPNHFAPKLCNAYVFTDYHMGMLAWHKESGADWDLAIAEKVLLGCFEQMIAAAPPARKAILIQLGDFLHTDGLVPVTPAHGNVLDADSRFQKIVAVTIRCLRKIANRLLEKHEEVEVLNAEGNHDPSSSIWLQQMFAALYENEPRMKVCDSPLPYYAFQWGKTMIAAHHGHLTKNGGLPGLMAAQFPKMWGETTKRYVHCGHRHHIDEKEHPGILVVQHPTLAARDAYAARGGWVAERAARCETYHSEFGHVARTIVTPEMVL